VERPSIKFPPLDRVFTSLVFEISAKREALLGGGPLERWAGLLPWNLKSSTTGRDLSFMWIPLVVYLSTDNVKKS
jgi:hypothetical protein